MRSDGGSRARGRGEERRAKETGETTKESGGVRQASAVGDRAGSEKGADLNLALLTLTPEEEERRSRAEIER